MMPTPNRRRWFQFSIGTMFLLVTLLAVWLGWELKFIRERKNAVYYFAVSNTTADHGPHIPIWRRLLGDMSYMKLAVPPNFSDDELAHIQSLFPEADVKRAGTPGSDALWVIFDP